MSSSPPPRDMAHPSSTLVLISSPYHLTHSFLPPLTAQSRSCIMLARVPCSRTQAYLPTNLLPHPSRSLPTTASCFGNSDRNSCTRNNTGRDLDRRGGGGGGFAIFRLRGGGGSRNPRAVSLHPTISAEPSTTKFFRTYCSRRRRRDECCCGEGNS